MLGSDACGIEWRWGRSEIVGNVGSGMEVEGKMEAWITEVRSVRGNNRGRKKLRKTSGERYIYKEV